MSYTLVFVSRNHPLELKNFGLKRVRNMIYIIRWKMKNKGNAYNKFNLISVTFSTSSVENDTSNRYFNLSRDDRDNISS
jgi:hypothetical protein